MDNKTQKLYHETLASFELFLSNAPVGFAIVNTEFRFVKINKMLAEIIYNRTVDEHIGKTVEDVIGRDYWSRLEKYYKNALRGVTSYNVEITGTTRGSFVSLLLSFYPLRMNKEIIGVGVIASNVTKQKLAEQQAESYRKRLAIAQKTGRVGVYEWDIVSNTTWWSDEEYTLLGVSKKEFDPKNRHQWSTHVLEEDKMSIFKKYDIQDYSKVKDINVQFRVLRPDGTIRWIDGKSSVVKDRDGNPVKVIGVNYDITSEKNRQLSSQFIARASKILSESLDYRKTLNKVATIAVPDMADWCTVDMFDEEGELQLVALAHKDPKKVKLGYQSRTDFPVDMSQNAGLPKVLKEGVTEFYPLITTEMIDASDGPQKAKDMLRKMGLTSMIIVPIKSKGKVLGAISLVTSESRRQFTTLEVQIAEQLAVHASLAIESSRLYDTVLQERERLNQIIESVPGVVWEAWGEPDKPDQSINYVSKYVEQMLGYSVDEWTLTPHFWSSIVHPDDRERAQQTAAAHFKKGGNGTNRFRWICKDGSVIWVESRSAIVSDSEGNPIGMRGVTMDITQRMLAERRKDEFISMASHELKTPITSIKVFNQLLEKKFKDDPAAQKYLSRMSRQIDKLTNLVEDLLDMSKIQTGKLALRKEPFALYQLVQEVVETMRVTNDRSIYLNGKTDKLVEADYDRIGQVLINLISNAIKYSPNKKEVEVVVAATDSEITITVTDHGVGIPPEHHDHIFGRFYRVYEEDDKTFPGLGIGLYISQQIITRHNGRMWFTSKPGSGSSFYFTLPVYAH